ncbi:MAG: M56 family metallopeptidase [Bacteroides sp.]
MGLFFAYILKASVCLAVFYLFYRWLLSSETFHRFNRVALLGILLLSLLLPLIKVSTAGRTEVHQTVLSMEELLLFATHSSATTVSPEESFTRLWIQAALMLYLAGALFFVCRQCWTLGQMFQLVRSGRREKQADGIVRVVHQQSIAPFSWMMYIVISEKDLEENGREILIHERAHIRHHHSLDLLLTDSCLIFQWFNPAAWLLKQELQNIHEYEADETVIKEGVDAKQYQLLLIKKAVGTRLYSMANSFNHSKLKKRITMMLKERSNPWARLKYLYVLPLAAIAVTAFARPEVSNKVKEISAVKVNDLTAIVKTKVNETAEIPQRVNAALPADYTLLIPSVSNAFAGKQGLGDLSNRIAVTLKIVDDNGKPVEKGAVIVIPFSTNTGTITEEGGVVKMTGIPEGNSLRVFYAGHANIGAIVQAKEGTMTVSLPSMIRTDNVSVVQLESKPLKMKKELEIRFDANGKKTAPLVIVDGKELPEGSLNLLNPDKIESVSVQKDAQVVALYGDKAKNGVILITLKDGSKENKGATLSKDSLNSSGESAVGVPN